MSTFHAFVSTCLIIVVAFALAAYLMLRNYLTTIGNQLWKIYDGGQAFIRDTNDVWFAIFRIRDDTAKITGLLDNDEEESEEDADISEGGWTMAPCPVCGGPAKMYYDREVNGYFIQCARREGYNDCGYGNVAGGPTRLSAATAWNKSVVHYCRLKMEVETDES